MYSTEFIDKLKAEAEEIALIDRKKYKEYIQIAEQYAVDNNLIVCGKSATRILLNEYDFDSMNYHFFADVADVFKLAKLLYKVDPTGISCYTTVITDLPGRLYSIVINCRKLFQFTVLPTYRGINTFDLLIPTMRPSRYLEDKLECIGPELQLIPIYQTLCNPALAGEWVENIKLETKMRKIFRAEFQEKMKIILGGGSDGKKIVALMSGSHYPTHFQKKFLTVVREKFMVAKDRVAVGQVAISKILGREITGAEKLQVISADLKADGDELEGLGKIMNMVVTWRIDDPKIPTHPRLRRLTAYYENDHETNGVASKTPFINIYNAAEFDLIPFIRGTVGTPYLIMYYRLIDMWTVNILYKLKIIKKEYAQQLLVEMFHSFGEISDHLDSILGATEVDTEVILPKTSYVGEAEDAGLALKRVKTTKFVPPVLVARM